MAIKYRATYKDSFDQTCMLEIEPVAGYFGETIPVRAVANTACVISRDGSDDPFEPIIYTKAAIQLWQDENYSIDIRELQEAADRDFTVALYINNKLEFKGFLIPDGIQRIKQAAPFELSINAVCGLSLLSGIEYSHSNLTGGRNTINYVRQILLSQSNLGMNLPVRWVSDLVNLEYPNEQDILSGSVTWAPRGEGFTDYNGNIKKCEYILENMMRANQCRISQNGGMWKVERINAMSSGKYKYRELTGLDNFNVIEYPVTDFTKNIDSYRAAKDYAFIEENAIISVLPGLKTVTTKYEQEQRESILPNGNMNIVETVRDAPMYWYCPGADVRSIPSLSEAKGMAAEVTNTANGVGGGYLKQSRPPESIDQSVWNTRYEMNFFFTGTAQTGDTILISDKNRNTGVEVNVYKYTVPAVFNGDTLGALRNFAATVPGFRETPSVDYNPAGQEYRFYWVGFNDDVANRQEIKTVSQTGFSFVGVLPIDTDVLYTSMNFGYKFNLVNGYTLTTGGLIDWNKTPNAIRVSYHTGTRLLYLNEFGYWTEQNTQITINVNQLKPNDIASIDFSNKQGINGVIMPLPDPYPIPRTTEPYIKIEFIIPSGRRMQFDDIYMKFNENSDVYEGTVVDSRNTKTEEYTLKISSAHSGFYVSNYMTDYAKSGLEKLYSDGVYTGTLTAINTHAILRMRYKASAVFKGSIYGKQYNYSEIYNIAGEAGKKFLPLMSSWNTETNTIELDCIEIRNDSVEIEMKHYGSNDKNE